MKLDNKYFVPFMAVGAFITMIFIVYSSFVFKNQQSERFEKNARFYTGLLTDRHPILTSSDSLQFSELEGSNAVIFFWASWSEKSELLMQELESLKSQNPGTEIVAALVMDATDSAKPSLENHKFRYIDGTQLFNELKAPGIPTVLLLDKTGTVITTHVGFQDGVGDVLAEALEQ